jgi:intein/homing endonuclease
MPIVEKISPSEIALYEVIRNPVLFGEFLYNIDRPKDEKPFELSIYQKEYLCDFNDRVSFMAGRSVGKTLSVSINIVWALIFNIFPDDYLVYTVPNKVHLEPVFTNLVRMFRTNTIMKYFIEPKGGINGSEYSITLLNHSKLICRIAGQSGGGANVNGLHSPYEFCDEGGFYPWGTWIEFQPTLNTWQQGYRLSVSGVPTGLRENNVLYYSDEISEGYSHHRVSAYENPRFTEEDKNSAVEQYGGEEAEDFVHFVCFTPDTKILTNHGLVNIKDIKIGDVILTHKGNWKKVTNTFSREYSGKLLSIKTQGNYTRIRCTPNHPIYSKILPKVTWSGNDPYVLWKGNTKNGGKKKGKEVSFLPEFIPASKLNKSDRVAFPSFVFNNNLPDVIDFSKYGIVKDNYVWAKVGARNNKTRLVGKFPKTIPLDKKILIFIGLFIAEGSTARNSQCQLVFNKKEIHLGALCKDVVENYFGLCCKISNGIGTIIVLFSSNIFVSFINEYIGHLAPNKKIPSFLLGVSSNQLLPLLEGLFAGDGFIRTRSGKPSASYTSVSENLVKQIAYILKGFNINPIIYKSENNNKLTKFPAGYSSITLDSYSLEINSKSISSIYTNNINTWDTFDTGELAIPITDILEEEYAGLVYNLEIEDDNSYVVENFAAHNCGKHGKPVFALFDRATFDIDVYPIYKIELNGIKESENIINYQSKFALIPSLPDRDSKCIMGIDLGYTEPTAIWILYFDHNNRLKFHAKIKLTKVSYPIQERMIDLLDSKFKPILIGIDKGSAGISVIQDLLELKDYIHKDYKKKIIPYDFATSIVMGIDNDGKEIKEKAKPLAVSVLQDWTNNKKLVYSSTDMDMIVELERMTYTKSPSGDIAYKTLTARGGKKGEDHFTSALLCAVTTYYLTNDFAFRKQDKPKLFKPSWI